MGKPMGVQKKTGCNAQSYFIPLKCYTHQESDFHGRN